MLTWEDDVEIHALRQRGWSISAIARHTGSGPQDDPQLSQRGDHAGGAGSAGARIRSQPFVDYVSARLSEDPHLWAAHAVR